MTPEAKRMDLNLKMFQIEMGNGHPWVPGAVFIECPGFTYYVEEAMHEYIKDMNDGVTE